MIDDTKSNIKQVDHGPFALVPPSAFKEADRIAFRAKSLCIAFYLTLIPMVGIIYVVIYPLTLFGFYQYVRLRYQQPLLFQFRGFYPGQSIRQLKKQAKSDPQLRTLLGLRLALFRYIFLVLWPALLLGLWFLGMASFYI